MNKIPVCNYKSTDFHKMQMAVYTTFTYIHIYIYNLSVCLFVFYGYSQSGWSDFRRTFTARYETDIVYYFNNIRFKSKTRT